MSIELILRAAAKMREDAASVPPSPWGTVEGTMGRVGMVTVVYGAPAEGSDTHPPVVYDIGMEMGPAAAYVVSWHPDVALAVADMLEWQASLMAMPEFPKVSIPTHPATALASKYLGEPA